MDQEKISPVITLIEFAIKQTEMGNDFFVSYHGHINNVSIRGYYGKWEIHKEPIENYQCDLSALTPEKVARWIYKFESELN